MDGWAVDGWGGCTPQRVLAAGLGNAEWTLAPGQAIGVDNTVHPVNSRLSLAKATRSLFNVFGIKWNDSTGTRNGHFAPFAWAG